MSREQSRSLEEDLPQLVRQWPLDLYQVAARVTADDERIRTDLSEVQDRSVIRISDAQYWLQTPGGWRRQVQELTTQQRHCGDVRSLLAALIASHGRPVTTVHRLQLGSLLQRKRLRREVDWQLLERTQEHVDTSLMILKNAIVEHGVARPFVHELLSHQSRRRAFDLLHEAHSAIGATDAEPDEVMTAYVTEEILAYVSAGEETVQTHAKTVRPKIFGRPSVPFVQSDPKPPRNPA